MVENGRLTEGGLGVCFIIFHFILKRLPSQTLYLNVPYVYIYVQSSAPEASKEKLKILHTV